MALTGPFLPYFQDRKHLEEESRVCSVTTGQPLRSFSKFLVSHLDSIPLRGTDAEGKSKLEVRIAVGFIVSIFSPPARRTWP